MRAFAPLLLALPVACAAVLAAIALSATLSPRPAAAADPAPAPVPAFTFPSIDGGTLDLSDWRGRPVLVVNTASLCAFTPQLEGLQALHDAYADRGLVVLAVPSDSFAQELASGSEVAAFCELTYGLTLPMTDITPVRGEGAHPFYRWLADTHGVRPEWNFAKVLIGPDGAFVQAWGPTTRPGSAAITRAVEALLPG
jgi:glutathione peroxidase